MNEVRASDPAISKRFLKNSFADVDYDNISVALLSEHSDAQLRPAFGKGIISLQPVGLC